MSKSVGQFLKDMLASREAKAAVPRCPQCMRSNQRSLVSVSGHAVVRTGALEVTQGSKTVVSAARRVETLSYRCSLGHQWTETDVQELP